jgi:periplasmic divalent cation tolerance protein
MPTQDHIQLVLCTCPDRDSARAIAENLIDQKLAACVNILPGIESVYSWQGKRENAREHLLFIKTAEHIYDEVEKTITGLHPYDLPEVIALNIENGSAGYLKWINENIKSDNTNL